MVHTALLLVDLQKEWVKEDSELYVGDIRDTIARIQRLIRSSREQGYKIVFTKHVEDETGGVFDPGSTNIDLLDEVEVRTEDTIIEKHRISPFFRTRLSEELEGIGRIIVCGILTNLCVRSLIQDAYDRDFDIVAIKDCCVAFDEETQEFTFKDLQATREELTIIDTEAFLSDIENQRTTPTD